MTFLDGQKNVRHFTHTIVGKRTSELRAVQEYVRHFRECVRKIRTTVRHGKVC